MTESTPLYDGLAAGDPADPTPVDSPVDSSLLQLPAGPDCDALDAFAASLPDDGHRDVALQTATAVRALCGQITALQAAVAALQPPAAPTPAPTPDPAPATT